MEALKLIMAGLGCVGLLMVGSCTMLGMGTAAMLNKAVEIEKQKQAERKSGADSSRFGSSSRYDYPTSYTPEQRRSPMDDSDWEFGDPSADASKR